MFPQLVDNKESDAIFWSMGHNNSEWTEVYQRCRYVNTEIIKNVIVDSSQDDFNFFDSIISGNSIQAQFQVLNNEIKRLNDEIETLKTELNKQEVLELREIPLDQARNEIKEWIKCQENSWYYSDIVEELGIDLEYVVKIIDDLNKDGLRIIEQE